MSLSVKRLIVGPIEENCYIVTDPERKKGRCFIVDPGAGGSRIVGAMKEDGLVPEAIFLTHGHFDHIMAVQWVLREYPGVTVYALDLEREVLEDPEKSLISNIAKEPFIKDISYLGDGDELMPAGIKLKVIATPGHTAGSACYYAACDGVLFSGDTLYYETFGRADLPTGSTEKIRKSICETLMQLPDETKVYPGHSEETSIGHERKYNIMVRGADFFL